MGVETELQDRRCLMGIAPAACFCRPRIDIQSRRLATLTEGLHGFPQSFKITAERVPVIRFWPLATESFPIYFSGIMLQFHAAVFRVAGTIFNKPCLYLFIRF
jgi:hypothetical protein